MDKIRKQKYDALLKEAGKAIIKGLGDGKWSFEISSWFNIGICFWLKDWDTSNDDETTNFPYFVIGGLSLDYFFMNDEKNPPYVCIYAKEYRNINFDLRNFRRLLVDVGSQALKAFPNKREDDDTWPIYYSLTEEERLELRRLLLEDEPGFVNALFQHADLLAKLEPAITQILSKQK